MHFFKNSVSFIAVMCVFGAAYAAVAPARGRVGVVATHGTASRRLPSLINILRPGTASTGTTTTTTTTTTTSVALLSDQECVDKYRTCMKGGDACGAGFEECTNNVLFHGHMGECFSTLYQCSDEGLAALFGTSSLEDLSESTVLEGTDEISNYTYPTPSSVMGMDIAGAAIRNKLSTGDCVKKYKKCLNKDTICGEDFELCTTVDEFKKQAPMCDSTLARCQSEGLQQLFGSTFVSKPSLTTLSESSIQNSIVSQWISDGAALAAANAVNTCYKVIDSCFVNACKKNPYRCVDGVKFGVVNAADWIGSGGVSAGGSSTSSRSFVTAGVMSNLDSIINNNTRVVGDSSLGTTTSSDVRRFFRAACESTIGGNKYCFMTLKEDDNGAVGRAPNKDELLDPDNQSDIFDEAYTTRKNILNSKIKDEISKFNKDAQDKCLDTFKTCAINSCAGGSGAACYSKVFKAEGQVGSINGTNTYDSIKQGCEGVVNTDANCIYMAAVEGSSQYESFGSNDETAFSTLFPTYATGGTTPIVVAALNADLSSAYNDVAIAETKKQCRNVVLSCAKSLCGTDYQNCYRNRSDVVLDAYSTDVTYFDRSMNRAGGVLDYTVVQGLCMNSVTNSDVCAESLAMAQATIAEDEKDTVSSAWRNSARGVKGTVLEKVQATDASGNDLCECTDGSVNTCDETHYGTGGEIVNCNQKYYVDWAVELNNQAATALFQEVLADVEREAQALYKAKLTKEQNICLAQNGGSSANATYVWAKLTGYSKKVNEGYATNGFQKNETVASNELYNSFCRMKIDLRSEDRDIQNLLSGNAITVSDLKGTTGFLAWGTEKFGKSKDGSLKGDGDYAQAYFAAGDTFQCGSWVSQSTLDAITEKVRHDAMAEAGAGSAKDRNVKLWTTLGLGTAGAIAGYFGMDAIQNNGNSLGGLLKRNAVTTDSDIESAKKCVSSADTAESYAASLYTAGDDTKFNSLAGELKKEIKKLNNAAGSANVAGYVSDGIGTATADNLEALKTIVGASTDAGIRKQIKTMREGCENKANYKDTNGKYSESERTRRFGRNAIAGTVGMLGTAALAGGIVASTQKAKYETAADEAVRDWMNTVGKKIHCYVNGQQVGDFGDLVTISITED